MKGVMFNLVAEVVTSEYGERMWDDILDDAEVAGSYTSVGAYPDSEFVALITAASRRLGIPVADLTRSVGRQALLLLAQRYPEFFTGHTSTRTFLPSLNQVIHPEVRKLYPGSDPPTFGFPPVLAGPQATMSYHSSRGMCVLAEGLALGAGDYYGEDLSIDQTTCTHRGDPFCTLSLTWNDGSRG